MQNRAHDFCFTQFASLEDAMDTGQWDEAQRHAARIANALRPRSAIAQEPIVWLYAMNLDEALRTANWEQVRTYAQRIVDTLGPPKEAPPLPIPRRQRSDRVIDLE